MMKKVIVFMIGVLVLLAVTKINNIEDKKE
jgi:hypothetical protein